MTATTHIPKYLNQFLLILFPTFPTGLIFARQLKQLNPVVKVLNNTVKNWPRYFEVCHSFYGCLPWKILNTQYTMLCWLFFYFTLLSFVNVNIYINWKCKYLHSVIVWHRKTFWYYWKLITETQTVIQHFKSHKKWY